MSTACLLACSLTYFWPYTLTCRVEVRGELASLRAVMATQLHSLISKLLRLLLPPPPLISTNNKVTIESSSSRGFGLSLLGRSHHVTLVLPAKIERLERKRKWRAHFELAVPHSKEDIIWSVVVVVVAIAVMVTNVGTTISVSLLLSDNNNSSSNQLLEVGFLVSTLTSERLYLQTHLSAHSFGCLRLNYSNCRQQSPTVARQLFSLSQEDIQLARFPLLFFLSSFSIFIFLLSFFFTPSSN